MTTISKEKNMNHVNDLASALYSALYVDLPAIPYQKFQTRAEREAGTEPVLTERRPTERDVEVQQFEQTWGSTALGHGGMGGAAMTTAATTIITCHNTSAVYFGGRYCYSVRRDCKQFIEDTKNRSLHSKHQAPKRYTPANGTWI